MYVWVGVTFYCPFELVHWVAFVELILFFLSSFIAVGAGEDRPYLFEGYIYRYITSKSVILLHFNYCGLRGRVIFCEVVVTLLLRSVMDWLVVLLVCWLCSGSSREVGEGVHVDLVVRRDE